MSCRNPEKELIEKVRREILPGAVSLKTLIEELSSKIRASGAASDQTLTDVDKLAGDAGTFQSDVDVWFPENPGAEVKLRSSRHDSRNRLNHLFGIIQLLQFAPEAEAHAELISRVASELEQCLGIVSQQKVENEEEHAAAAAPKTDRSKTTAAVAAGGEFSGSEDTALILIADDDKGNRDILARLLEPNGYTVQFAENGREAIEKINETDFDAVLLDIQMPEMDGFEVLAKLNETGQLRQTPVIVVTGLQDETDAVRCIEIGAEDFLSRPIRPALLMARLNASLEKKRLREKVFEQHFTPELARELARNPDPMKMQARNADVTVLFCDIRRFSAISERMGPAQTIDWLSGVMGDFSTIVIDLGGVLVDYTGDELMAMWGAPNAQPNHAELACKAGIKIMESLADINDRWRDEIKDETRVGVGINSGQALVGNIGTHRKFKYGPLGTVVNLSSRVQGATKYLKTPLLITGATAEQLSDDICTRRLCQVQVMNIKKPVDLYQIVSNENREDCDEMTLDYEKALDYFEKSEFHRASAILGDLLVKAPNDGPTLQLMARVVEAMLNDSDDFSPVWELPGK